MNIGGSFARYSMAGWAFVVVLLASFAFSPNQRAWTALTSWLSGSAAANQAASGIAVAAVGIIAGVSAPPALGYVLARAAAGIFENLRFYLRYGGNRKEQAHNHAIFFSRAAQNLITWREERTTQVYASWSCALAGIGALFVAGIVYGAVAVGVIVVTAILAVLLSLDALYQDRARHAVVDAWFDLPDLSQQPPR